ncbi:hypothetical protein [Taylorella equigenitalis]|uniref:hypothetical protein n=1 Tax=Taylorella equigenitalis TaxID=29575 RepID=UPI00237CEA00|nr:hypothetical protein [Taylorella equigenitalis]WDU55628.1 hypothetical protein KPZ19_06130 [Taylorella equigenitalis]
MRISVPFLIAPSRHADWEGKTLKNGTVQKVEFSANFCSTKSIQKSGASTEQEDVSTICTEGKDYEAGSREEGNITLNLFLSSSVFLGHPT